MNQPNLNDENQQGPEVREQLATTPVPNKDENAVQWYFLVGDKTCGPATTTELRTVLASGAIPNNAYVFREGMKDWANANAVPEFQDCTSGSSSVASHTSNSGVGTFQAPKGTKPRSWLKVLSLALAGATIITIISAVKLYASRTALNDSIQQAQAEIQASRVKWAAELERRRVEEIERRRVEEREKRRVTEEAARFAEQQRLSEMRKQFSFERVSAALVAAGFTHKHTNPNGSVSFELNEGQYPAFIVERQGDHVMHIRGGVNANFMLKLVSKPGISQEGVRQLLKQSVDLYISWGKLICNSLEKVTEDPKAYDWIAELIGTTLDRGLDATDKGTMILNHWNVTVSTAGLGVIYEAKPAE
jgi:hypothetical protein